MNNCTEGFKSNKIYVWVQLNSLPKSAISTAKLHGRTIDAAPLNRGRGVSFNKGSNDEAWGWTPAYYSCTACSDPKETSASVDSSTNLADVCMNYFTVIQLEEGLSIGNFDCQEFNLSEAQTREMFKSGNLRLANLWEEVKFMNIAEELSERYNNSLDSEEEDDEDTKQRAATNWMHEDKSSDSPPHNLIEMTHLHEPSVVHALRHRYQNSTQENVSSVYTGIGPILLAVNPFEYDSSEKFYGENTMKKYRTEGEKKWIKDWRNWIGDCDARTILAESPAFDCNGDGAVDGDSEDNLPTHVYALADRAFRIMMTRLHLHNNSTSSSKISTRARSIAGGAKTLSISAEAPKINQSVLVSGESGSGKTVTTKFLMGYIAKLTEHALENMHFTPKESIVSMITPKDDMTIERRVLESNPIMESFGNARTIRNDNSSRFGKYIEMRFSSKKLEGSLAKNDCNPAIGATLIGANIETYLLEKVRLVHQSFGERNYHIFYELFSLKYDDDGDNFIGIVHETQEESFVSRKDLVEKFGLHNYDMEDFCLINASDTYDRRDGVLDADTFRDVKRAMAVMGFNDKERNTVFGVTSALLHASNLTFQALGEMGCVLEMSNPHLEFIVDLLEVTKEGLNQALCFYDIVIGGTGKKNGETHRKVLSQAQAEKGVKALIKATYGALFTYLVSRINASIAGSDGNYGQMHLTKGKSSDMTRSSDIGASIGILDIFGFESFQLNSFEQLCINYCNEVLQQQFNRFVLRNEQEEYEREGIKWSFIDFPENQDVLDLINFKNSGVLNVLHDQCRTPGASDKTFASVIYEKFSTHPRFEADSRQVAEQYFAIHHYAGSVEYSIKGFVEKNRDELPKEGADLLLSSTNKLVRNLAEILQASSALSSERKKIHSPRTGAPQRPTVGIQFSNQLHDLRVKIDATSPHYIRCLKPNNLLVPQHFDAALIADQLRCSGVIEAARISRLGYPQRYSHAQFLTRYRVLGIKSLCNEKTTGKKCSPIKAIVHSIVTKINARKEKHEQSELGIQVGKSKIFLCSWAYDSLERMRRIKITSSAVRVQTFARQIVYRKRYLRKYSSIIIIQSWGRQCRDKKKTTIIRRQFKAIILQKVWRRCIALRLLLSARIIAVWCQVHLRGALGRARYSKINQERQALKIQTLWRCCNAVKIFRSRIDAVTVIQCAIRSSLSRVILKVKKAEARDLNAVIQERDRLRIEVNSLRMDFRRLQETLEYHLLQVKADAPKDCVSHNEDISSLHIALEQALLDKAELEKELFHANETILHLTSITESVVDQNDITLCKENDEKLKDLYQDLQRENTEASSKIKYLEEVNENLKKQNSSLLRKKDSSSQGVFATTSKKQNENHNDFTNNSVDRNILSETLRNSASNESRKNGNVIPSICTTCTTDMTDTDDELTKLREENQIMQLQLELLRMNQGPLPDIIGSDQEYEDSVNPSDGCNSLTDGDSTMPNSDTTPEKLMKQMCSDVEEATEEVIVKTRAESKAQIQQLQATISALQQELDTAKQHAKYDIDNISRANKSLHQELNDANQEVLEISIQLKEKCQQLDALNDDLEGFAETFAIQHQEVRQLERQVKRLQVENKSLRELDAANLKRIEQLQSLSTSKSDSLSDGKRLWEEISKIQHEILNMKNNPSPDNPINLEHKQASM